MDLDAAYRGVADQVNEDVSGATRLNLGDYLSFTAHRLSVPAGQEDVSASFSIDAMIGGHRFDRFRLDVAWTDPFLGSDRVVGDDLLSFIGINPAVFPSIPIEQHIAEKVHACTRTYTSGVSSRPKDLIDLVLFAAHSAPDAAKLRHALETTFRARSTHALPDQFPSPPNSWGPRFSRLAAEVAVPTDPESAWRVAANFLDPVLSEHVNAGLWYPNQQRWDSASR